MKKLLVLTLTVSLIVTLALVFSSCGNKTPEVLETNPPPVTTEREIKELTLEIFSTSYTNMTAWKKYTNGSSTETTTTTAVTTTASPTAEATPEQ